MAFEKIYLSNNDCRADENSYGIILPTGGSRKFAYAETPVHERNLVDPYAKFVDGRSLFELTLRRARNAISPKRLFVLVNRKHPAVDQVRAQHSLVWQPRCAHTMACVLLALMRIHNCRPHAFVTIFPVDHFIAPEAHFLSHLRLAWQSLNSDSEGEVIVLLGMEPHAPDLGYCYIVPEREMKNWSSEPFAKIALIGQAPNGDTAQKLIGRGALWHSGIIVAKCAVLIDAIKRVLPALTDRYPIIAEISDSAEENDRFEKLCRDLPALSFEEMLHALPWKHRRRLRVFSVNGVYWSELSNQRRQEECLEKLIGFGARTRSASPLIATVLEPKLI
jgi:mannose-1-phosphate guanylyltransferase